MRIISMCLLSAVAAAAVTSHPHVRSYIGRSGPEWGRPASAANAPTNAGVVYVGGEYNISIAKTALDAAGNVYAIGAQLVTIGAYTAHTVFVTKVDPSGATVYITRLGGKGDDIATGIGVDATGRVVGAGYTTSPDFPLLHAVQTEMSSQGTTGFVFALDASGVLAWSTYWGGGGMPVAGFDGGSVKAVAVDASGDAYVTGTSELANMATTPGAYQGWENGASPQTSNAFVAKFSPSGQIVYSTWLHGNAIDCNFDGCFYTELRSDAGTAIAVDSTGAAYVTGYTDTSDFPVTPGAYQTVCNCIQMFQSYHAFLTKLKPDGSGLVYSTLLGNFGAGDQTPPPPDSANRAIAIDSGGNAYVAFATTATPVTAASGVQPAPGGASDVLLLAVNSSGSALVTATYLGGSGDDSPLGIAIDKTGDIYVSGATASANFPDSYGQFPSGGDFVTELNPGAAKIVFSARLPGGLAARDIAIDPSTGALIATGSSGHIMRLNPFAAASFPALLGAGNAANGTIDSTLPGAELVTIYGTGIGPSTPVIAQPTPLFNSLAAAQYPDLLAGVQVSFNGQAAALTYASANQITAVVPANLSSPISMQIANNGTAFGPLAVAANSSQPNPGIFRNPDGTAATLNQDGTVNGQANPAHGGTLISIWGTGVGGLEEWDGGGVPAQVYDVSSQGYATLLGEVDGAGAQPMSITYAGGAPGEVGSVFQINARLPLDNYGPAAIPWTLNLQSASITSPPVTVYVIP